MFSINADLDTRYVIVPLNLLLNYLGVWSSKQVEIKVAEGSTIEDLKELLIGDEYTLRTVGENIDS